MHDHGPGVKVPPPLLVALVILMAELINRQALALPLTFSNEVLSGVISGLFYVLGALLAGAAAVSFRHHKTNILPHKPDQQLMTNGIFAYSRNPIYLSFLAFQVALAFYFENMWALLGLSLSYMLLRYYVIAKEEAYLCQLFGDPYRAYLLQVRRWL